MSAHLGPLASALVDEQLQPAAREKALAHLVVCHRCTQEVRDIRTARAALSLASEEQPALSNNFMQGLLQMAHEEHAQAQREAIIAHREAFVDHKPVPGGEYCGQMKARKKLTQLAKYGAVFALGGSCVAAFLLGERPNITPRSDQGILAERLSVLRESNSFSPIYGVHGPVASGHGSTVDSHKLNGWLKEHGWTVPEALPTGVTITSVGFLASRPNELEFIMDTPVGEVVIIESHGILDVSSFDSPVIMEHPHGPIYKLRETPTHLVWQSGETMIEVIGQAASEQLMELAHSFKAEQHDSGYTAQLARGFTQLAGVVSE